MTTHEEARDVLPPLPPSPLVPCIESLEAEHEAKAKAATAAAPEKRSEVAAAGALFVFLLGLMTLAFGAVTLVMFV